MKYKVKELTNHHLVRKEDLNHHNTVFAGRAAELFVESAFIAAANFVPPNNIVCVKIDSLIFKHPAFLGDILCFKSKVIKAGRTSLTVYVVVHGKDCSKILVDGFATFVNVDENNIPQPHNIELEIIEEEDLKILEKLKLNYNGNNS